MANTPEDRDCIIITVGMGQITDGGGYQKWLRDFMEAMKTDDTVYYLRATGKPRHKPLYVYLCISGKIRFRTCFLGSLGEQTITFKSGRQLHARAWIMIGGPVEVPPFNVPRKGFRGFRYTKILF